MYIYIQQVTSALQVSLQIGSGMFLLRAKYPSERPPPRPIRGSSAGKTPDLRVYTAGMMRTSKG
ncbi:MAG: hypothetical protein J7578_22785 [Chitinophagaceae bacterium]|nr:hypothetical protein [Chitinophagaceae bacterium]